MWSKNRRVMAASSCRGGSGSSELGGSLNPVLTFEGKGWENKNCSI